MKGGRTIVRTFWSFHLKLSCRKKKGKWKDSIWWGKTLEYKKKKETRGWRKRKRKSKVSKGNTNLKSLILKLQFYQLASQVSTIKYVHFGHFHVLLLYIRYIRWFSLFWVFYKRPLLQGKWLFVMSRLVYSFFFFSQQRELTICLIFFWCVPILLSLELHITCA